jgi:hypothetical protein
MTREEICCPEFDPSAWDEKTYEWNNKRFVKGKVFTLFYMPVNFGAVITKLMGHVEKSNAQVVDGLCLSDHTSLWNMDMYLAVDREIPGAKNETLSGKMFSKVYEGPFKDTGKWCKSYEETVREKGMTVEKQYLWYTTCPKCAKKYGKNYVVIMGRVQ